MNENRVITDRWSNASSQALYQQSWPDEPVLRLKYENGEQCGGCAFFAPFNYDYGLCCHDESRHFTETVFEHFTCAAYHGEGWEAHSFTKLRNNWDETKRAD